MLTAEQILAADDLPRIRVDCPEWCPAGGDPAESFVYVRRMTGDEYLNDYTAALQKSEDERGLRLLVCVLSICDECGKRLFSLEQLTELASKSSEPLKRLFEASAKINGLTNKEELEKN